MNRIDFTLLFDVTDGNPNGDPDAGNMPRQDAETGHGIITDVCIKRKVRNYVDLTRCGQPGYGIYVREGAILEALNTEAYTALNLDASKNGVAKVKARAWMCENYFDIRTFGALMASDTANCGQVRGPVQLSFGRSIDSVVVDDHAITRLCVTNIEDAKKERTIGRKYTVPYGLYRMHGFINPFLAEQTGFSDTDLALIWEAFAGMFELDRSAGRGLMSVRRLIVFEHESKLGNAPAHKVLEAVKVVKKTDVARSYADYAVTVGDVPPGVTVLEKV
jgi:CRISPR-associated protein Csd2